MRKKIIALFSALAMVITVMFSAFPVAAAGTLAMQTKASKTTVKQGETITVELVITENPGLVSIQTKAVYDTTAFEIVSVTDGAPFTGGFTFQNRDDDKSEAWWTNFGLAGDSTETGTLYTVTFKVKNDIENGDFEFTFDTWGDKVFNYDEADVPCTIQKATVKVNDGKSDDATLKSLVLSNKNVSLDPAFDPATEDYTVLLPNGSKVPTVTATKNDTKAKIQTTQAKSFNTGENVATIVVTAEKGNTKTYTVTFIEMNALLSSLKVNGTSVTGFDSNKTSYTYEVSYADWKADPAKTYAITATASKEDSTVAISEENVTLTSTDPTKNTDKNATVTVTSAQGDTTTYTIKFTVLACVHDYQPNEAGSTPATCTAAGTKLSVCSICGGEKTEAVKALGHDKNSEWTVAEATCEADGSRTQICSRCGETIAATVLKAKGHKWSKWTNVEGTGDYTRTCANSNCEIGTQTRTADIAEDGHAHDYSITEVIKPATCAEKGEQRTWCAVDGCASFQPDEIAMIDHTPRIEREEPTCTTEGAQREVCIVCGQESEWEVIDALGHDWADTWTSDENDHWHACTRCDADDEREAHTENEGVVTTPATTVSNGIKTYSCTVCEKTLRTEVLPMIADNTTPGLERPTEIYIGAPIIPFGGVPTESMSVKVENAITGKTSTARAQRNGSSVSVKLGAENNGYYANVFTTDDEYIYSAVIEGGKAEFNAPSDVKIKIVIDSIAYGEDVSSAAAADIESTEIASGNTAVYLAGVVLLAAATVMTVFIRKRANK